MSEIDVELAGVGAVLVEERVLRRVIKGHRKLRGVGLQVPHENCYQLPRDAFAELVESDEVAVEIPTLPERIVLIHGDRDKLATPEGWTAAWRAIFHARIHLAFEEKLETRRLTLSAIRERIHRVGQTEFDEIRTVLKQEDLLLPPQPGTPAALPGGNDITTYVEFVALYLELKHFAPNAIDRTFPALFDTRGVDETIAIDLDPADLLAKSRPPSAPEVPLIVSVAKAEERDTRSSIISESAKKSAHKAAMAARERGNRSRAAILHYRAGMDRGGEADLHELIARLAKALSLRDATPDIPAGVLERWEKVLRPVAEYAARQSSLRFSVGARLLHDLQSACVVGEREMRVVDFAAWVRSFGRRPIVRELPATREVRIAKHVRAAVAKVPACGVPSAELTDALHEIKERADHNVRAVMRPKLEEAMKTVGLVPHSLPEKVGEKKLIDELLDQAVAVGRLTIGNLRDAISKNDLKANDLALRELKTGDQLLRSDDMLAHSMDGVYRRGEQYMRYLQKFSSLLFGTVIGRFLTTWFLLPALGAVAVIEGLHHMVGPLVAKLTGTHPNISNPYTLIGCGVFLFLLIRIPPFRDFSIWAGLKLWKLIKLLLWDLPFAVWTHPITTRYFLSRVHRWGMRPLLIGAIVWIAVPSDYVVPYLPMIELRHAIAGGVLIAAMIAMNTRLWRITEERLGDWAVRSGRHVTTRLLPGAIKLILELFAKLIERLDRGIYRVDEWLRFRKGQSIVIIVIKGVLGAVWGFLTYLFRVYINLFVEPTVNPIKHFPVVTVAAKLIIPIIPAMLEGMTSATKPLLGAFASTFATINVILIPGLAGFLVWEFKENWKLYRVNRAKTLRPQVIGHHGESMIAFLKPGFHSGTIPKHYTKLRRAAWKDDERGVAKQREGLHHVEEAVATFVDRQLVSMLNEVPTFDPADVEVTQVEIGSNRVQFELACASVSREKARIRFEQQSGWLVASIPEPGWLAALDDNHRRIFEIALSGFYKLSGVDLVREQLEKALEGDAGAPPPYDISDEGLLIWPAGAYDTEVVYDLHKSKLVPKVRGHKSDVDLPDLDKRHARFGREPLYWSVWSTAWQQIARGEPPMPLLVGPSLLPRAPAAVVAA
jgi:hypothetical protein